MSEERNEYFANRIAQIVADCGKVLVAIDSLQGSGLTGYVGDVRQPDGYRQYIALVNARAAIYRQARNRAQAALRASATYDAAAWMLFHRKSARGNYALFMLRTAGTLRRVHAYAVIDVVGHSQTLDALFA